jgi:hypothetical protein
MLKQKLKPKMVVAVVVSASPLISTPPGNRLMFIPIRLGVITSYLKNYAAMDLFFVKG